MIRKILSTLKYQSRIIKYNPQIVFPFSANNNKPIKLSDDILNQLKKIGKESYQQTNTKSESYNYDLESSEQWQSEIEGSDIPVVVQMTATWCQPCKRLTPILSKYVNAAGGKWKLVRVDIDKHSQIASSLQIQSVPTVILVHKGNALDGFVGIPAQQKLQQFFENVNNISNQSEEENKLADIFQDLSERQEKQDYQGLQEKCLEILKDKNFVKYRYVIHFHLLKMYIQQGNIHHAAEEINILETKFAEDLKQLPGALEDLDNTKKILEELKAEKKEDNQLNQLLNQLDQEPANLELRLSIVNYCKENQLYEQAIQHCLDNSIAKETLLKIFAELGSSNTLVIEGRKKLQRLLF